MNEERMLILKMVAEGKITAEEGESLLQTLDTLDETGREPSQQSGSEDQQESIVELLKTGAESLRDRVLNERTEIMKDTGRISREVRRSVRNSLRDTLRDMLRDSNRDGGRRARHRDGGHRVCHEEPRAQMQLETSERLDLEIEHRHGDIEVTSWEESNLRVDYQITVWAEDEETAKEIASEIEIQIDPDEASSGGVTQVSIRTNYPEDRELWRNNRRRAQVDYWLVVPRQTNLELDNRHGNVSAHDLRGTTMVGNRHGDVSLCALDGALNLDTHHGNVKADSIQGNVRFNGSHGCRAR